MTNRLVIIIYRAGMPVKNKIENAKIAVLFYPICRYNLVETVF